MLNIIIKMWSLNSFILTILFSENPRLDRGAGNFYCRDVPAERVQNINQVETESLKA